MPVTIRDCDGGIGNIILGTGIITDQELLVSHRDHYTQDEAKFRKYRFCLADYTGVTKTDISADTLRIMAGMAGKAVLVNPDAVVALAASKDLVFGFARMSQMLQTEPDWERQVFRSREEAEAWLRERVNARFGIEHILFE